MNNAPEYKIVQQWSAVDLTTLSVTREANLFACHGEVI